MAISKPFYIKTRDCPQKTSTSKICKACEKVSGTRSMKAAMWDKNVWVLNANSEEARVFLLGAGFINIEGAMIRLYADHPFIALDKDGNKIPSTKLVIDGIPIDIDGDIITRYLSSIGINTRSKLNFENAWDPETKSLSEWLTGKRFIYIDLPQNELKKSYKVGQYEMKLYYKEMEKETPRCKRCFGAHWTNTCREEERCLSCKLTGHRRGDPTCPKVIQDFEQSDEESEEDIDDEKPDEQESDNYISADESEQRRNNEKNGEQIINEQKEMLDDEIRTENTKEDGRNGETGEAPERKAETDHESLEADDGKNGNETTSAECNDKPKGTLKTSGKDKNGEENPKDKKQPEKNKTGKFDKKNVKDQGKANELHDKARLNRQNSQKLPLPKQDRGRSQERLDRYVQRQDRSASKRRASKSPVSASNESKFKKRESYAAGRGSALSNK